VAWVGSCVASPQPYEPRGIACPLAGGKGGRGGPSSRSAASMRSPTIHRHDLHTLHTCHSRVILPQKSVTYGVKSGVKRGPSPLHQWLHTLHSRTGVKVRMAPVKIERARDLHRETLKIAVPLKMVKGVKMVPPHHRPSSPMVLIGLPGSRPCRGSLASKPLINVQATPQHLTTTTVPPNRPSVSARVSSRRRSNTSPSRRSLKPSDRTCCRRRPSRWTPRPPAWIH
jgi:hypothetical protein